MSKKIKRPEVKIHKSRLGAEENIGEDDQYPLFSFRHSDRGKYGHATCTHAELRSLMEALCKISQLTWNQLQTTQRHGLGSEKIANSAIKASKNTLPQWAQDSDCLAFRFAGKAPMIGVRSDKVWMDRNFKAYKH